MKLDIKKFFRFNIIDLLSFGCLIFLVLFLWFVEKPKMEMVKDCNDVYRKQMEKYSDFELNMTPSNFSFNDLSECPPCVCKDDLPTTN